MKCTSVSNHKPRNGAPREATAALLPQQGPAATTPLAPPAASGPHNATPHPPPITATAKLPPCVKCSRGFLDITELLRQGLPTLPPNIVIGGNSRTFVDYVPTAMLPYPVEENIWLGGPRPACVASIPDHVNTAAAAAPPPPPGEAGGGADTPESPERDLARLLPYVQVQAAAAAGNISPRDQVALMQRLLLLLLPLLQGQGPSDTFLRCMFFKQPLPPILSAYKAGHWKSASPAAAAAAAAAASTASAAVATASAQGKADKDAAQTSGRPRGASAAVTQGRVTKSTRIATAATAAGSVPVFACADDDPPALALTSRLGLLRLFCAVYARLCIRLHALGCFGALEGLMFADEAEMSAVDTAWDMLVRLGPKPPQRRQQQGERLSQQELIDTREEEFAAWATDSWPVEDTCFAELLLWRGFKTPVPPAAAAKKTRFRCRQDGLLQALPEAAQLLSADEEAEAAAALCCRFLQLMGLFVECLAVIGDLEAAGLSPYDPRPFIADNEDEVIKHLKCQQFINKCKYLQKFGLTPDGPSLHAALNSIDGMLHLLQQNVWLHPLPCSSRSGSSSTFDVELCFKPFFRHFRGPVLLPPAPVPSVTGFCCALSRMLGKFNYMLSGSWETDVPPCVPLSWGFRLTPVLLLPRVLLEDVFTSLPEHEESQIRGINWIIPRLASCVARQGTDRRAMHATCPEHGNAAAAAGAVAAAAVAAAAAAASASAADFVACVGSGHSPPSGTSSSAAAAVASAATAAAVAAAEAAATAGDEENIEEIPSYMLRILSYAMVTSDAKEFDALWSLHRLHLYTPQEQQQQQQTSIIDERLLQNCCSPIFLPSQFCSCQDCNLCSRWRWHFKQHVLDTYSTLHETPQRQQQTLQKRQQQPQEFVRWTVQMSVSPAAAPAATKVPKASTCPWGPHAPLIQQLPVAIALSIDALLLQQQHVLALVLLLQLYQYLEEITIYWSLLNVVLSIEDIRQWHVRQVVKDGEERKKKETPRRAQMLLSLFLCGRFILMINLRLRPHDVQNMRSVFWPFYSVRCSALHASLQPLLGLKPSGKALPAWGLEAPRVQRPKRPAARAAAAAAAAAADTAAVARLAHIPTLLVQRFSFDCLCSAIEANYQASTKGASDVADALQGGMQWLSRAGQEQQLTSAEKAMIELIRIDVGRLRDINRH